MNNQQNESPFGNPRFLITLAVTFIGLWGWQYYMAKNYPKQNQVVQSDVKTQTTGQTSEVKQGNQDAVSPSAGTKKSDSLAVIAPTEGEKLFNYEDDNVQFTVSSIGMGVKEYSLKKYTDRSGARIDFNTTQKQADLIVNNQIPLFTVEKKSDTEFVGTAIVQDKKIVRTLKYNKDLQAFESSVSFDVGFDKIQTQLFQKQHIPQSTSFLMPSFEHQDFIYIEAGSTKTENITKVKPGEGFIKSSTGASLASIGTQYFTVASLNKSEIIPEISNKVENSLASVTMTYNLKDTKISEIKQILFLGPKKTELLNAIDSQMIEVLNYGMFGAISKLLMKLLVLIHSFVGNWGLAIIVMTLIVRTALLPFNVMSFRSAQSMQKAKPQMDRVREQFKDDPIRMNRETMAIMKEHNANPLSGCLPMLLQIPIFFALWRAIGSSIEIYQQPFFGWITDLSYHDKFFVFPVLMGITMYFQQKLTPTTMDPTQAKILNFMPILFTLFMLTLPSGLTLYNFVSALFGVIQQYILLKEKNKHSIQTA